MPEITFRAPCDYKELGIDAGDLCRYGRLPGLLEAYHLEPMSAEQAEAISRGLPFEAVRMLADGTPAVASRPSPPAPHLALVK
jgi:hypothetical protein